MIRALIGLLIAAIAAAFIRAVMAMISREVSEMVNPTQKAAEGSPPPPKAEGGSTPLKKCPVCGTYSPADKLIRGQYCSEACAAKLS